MVWDGDERREHCDNHEQNTRDISELKASSNTIKWLLMLGVPIAFAILSAFASMAYNGIQESLMEIKADIREVKQEVKTSSLNIGVMQQQIAVNTRRLDNIEYTMRGR